jgi:hypothetical protein
MLPRLRSLSGLWLIGALFVTSTSCADGGLTEIVVVVDSELPVPSVIDEVRIDVEGATDAAHVARALLAGPGSVPLPVTLGLRPAEPGNARVTIRASGLREGERRVASEVRTGFVEGRRLVVRMVLLSACVEVECAEGETCAPDGRCIPSNVDPLTLPPFTAPPEVRVPVDGGDGAMPLGEGASCASDSACASLHCECVDFDCTQRVCAPAQCLCGYGTSGSCGDPLRPGIRDPGDCDGPTSGCQGVDTCVSAP